MATYAIAVKRAKRDQISLGQALERIRDIAGVEIVGDGCEGSAMIIAGEQAIAEVGRRLEFCCHIEHLIRHHPLAVA